MTSAYDIYTAIDSFAPFASARPGDNVGFLVGRYESAVTHCLVATDATPEVIREAAAAGAELLVTHHPIIYDPLRALTGASPALLAAENRLAVICAHTNLDIAPGGVGDVWLARLGFEKLCAVEATGGCAVLAKCPPELSRTAALAKHVAQCAGITVKFADGGREIKTVGVCCGGGGSFTQAVFEAGADAFITGDVRYPQAVDALREGRSLIDVGHFETESVVCAPLAARLAGLFPGVRFALAASERHPFEFLAP